MNLVFIFSLLFVNIILFTVTEAKTDKTIVNKAIGKDVVEAVVTLIEQAGIFPDDHGFLKRMAYVETHFGEDVATFTSKYNNSIWGVFEQFNRSKDVNSRPNLKALHEKILHHFGIDWNKVTVDELVQPLISALTVRLYFAIQDEPIPILLEEQAKYFKEKWDSTITQKVFVDRVREMEKLDNCLGRMDLAIVMDGSASIKEENFKLAKQFVSSLLDTFSLQTVDIGYIVFSASSEVVIPFDSNLSLAQMKAKVIGSKYPDDRTNTQDAIKTAINMLKSAKHMEGSPRIMTIFTDGAPDRPVTVEVAEAKAANITMFAVGIGNDIHKDELLTMTYNDPTHVFSMSSYKALSESFELMNSETCKIAQKPKVGNEVKDSLREHEKRYFCYDMSSEGLFVTIKVINGKIIAYYSYSQENPSSALNDGVITADMKTLIPQLLKAKRVCITVEGLEKINNYTIITEKGNGVPVTLAPTGGPTGTESPDTDSLLKIRKKAKEIAEKAFHDLDDYNEIAEKICHDLSKLYSKEEWICVVGEKLEVSEHQRAKSMFQFGFSIKQASVYIIVNIPDDFLI